MFIQLIYKKKSSNDPIVSKRIPTKIDQVCNTVPVKSFNKCVYVRLSGGGDDLVHFNFPKVVSVGDVIGDAAVEEDRFLGYNSHLPP